MNTAPERTGSLGHQVTDMLTTELRNLLAAIGERVVREATDRIGSLTENLADYAAGKSSSGGAAVAAGASRLAGGASPVRAALSAGTAGLRSGLGGLVGGAGSDAKNGDGGNGAKAVDAKVTNIYEMVDVGVPVRTAYDQWTQFADFPSFMKKVENVDQESDGKTNWKAQVLWSHRQWTATIVEQIPDRHITWRSEGEKGTVDGTVSFHRLAPDLTGILLVLEYHPQGFFEKTGNIWRAQGRRARLELKHFARHVMTRTLTAQDDLVGWRGEIRDGEVVRDHESAVREQAERDGPDDGYDDRYDAEQPEDAEPDGDMDDDDTDDDDEDEDEDDEDEDDEDEDDEDEDDEDEDDEDREDEDREPEPPGRPAGRRRRRSRADEEPTAGRGGGRRRRS